MPPRRLAHEFDIPAPEGLQCASVVLGDTDYVILSFPRAVWEVPPGLTPAEQAIALAILDGATNQDIARLRSSSLRTVANQVAAVFRKLAVSSRLELALKARLTPSHISVGE